MLNSLLKNIRSRRAKPQPSSFLPAFERDYAALLGQRAAGFRIMFQQLEALAERRSSPLLIVETGSLRVEGNWADGQSTLLWKEFSRHHRCDIHTVDLNAAASVLVRRLCGNAVEAHTKDSVAFLHDLACAPRPRQIDLLYLDSYDFEPDNPFPSAMHHVKELIAARPCLGAGSLVAIDDNIHLPDGGYTGKGYLAMQWFEHLGIECLHSGYQFVWRL